MTKTREHILETTQATDKYGRVIENGGTFVITFCPADHAKFNVYDDAGDRYTNHQICWTLTDAVDEVKERCRLTREWAAQAA